jgi:hypothetical protein
MSQPITSLVKIPTGWISLKDLSINDPVITALGHIAYVINMITCIPQIIYRLQLDIDQTIYTSEDQPWWITRPTSSNETGVFRLTTRQVFCLINGRGTPCHIPLMINNQQILSAIQDIEYESNSDEYKTIEIDHQDRSYISDHNVIIHTL